MVDLHIHKNNSDGDFTTEEVLALIKKIGIDFFSITDHDNINSCKEMEKIIIPENMKYIPGVEFSSKTEKLNLHILGYNIDYNNQNIINECEIIRKRKIEKITTIINYLKKYYGIDITEQEEKNILEKQGTIGRMDICKLLMKKGYGIRKQIYDDYLTDIPNTKTHRSDIETITKIIHESNGIAVLAHPKKIEKEFNISLSKIIEELIEKEIDGIEVYNSVHTLKDIKRYLMIAKKYNLLVTGGSDFHGQTHPERQLGYTSTQKIKINSSNIKLH